MKFQQFDICCMLFDLVDLLNDISISYRLLNTESWYFFNNNVLNVSLHFLKIYNPLFAHNYVIKYSYVIQIISKQLLCYQVFLSNTNNFQIVMGYQVFLSNTDNLNKVIWYQLFPSNTNNLHTVIISNIPK